jgi:hypothetical protein
VGLNVDEILEQPGSVESKYPVQGWIRIIVSNRTPVTKCFDDLRGYQLSRQQRGPRSVCPPPTLANIIKFANALPVHTILVVEGKAAVRCYLYQILV